VAENRPKPPGGYRKGTPPPPIVAYEDVIASCGHPEKFGLFEDRLDKYRQGRRKKVTGRPCAACRERRRLELEAEAQARQAAKQQRTSEAARSPKAPAGKGRLPDGSRFEVIYDAARTQWSGTLTVQEKAFTSSAGSLFKLLNKLDRLYRQGLRPPDA
jgi:hypothetical protein